MQLTRDGEVFVLRLNHGENRMDAGFVAEWNSLIDEVAASRGDASLVTVGTDRFFSNGLDLDWLSAQESADLRIFFRELFASWARLLTLPMVSVAAINGHAFGTGALLSLAHHRRVIRDDRGWWCMPEADNGWTLQPAMTSLIRCRLTPQAAHATILGARRWTASEAVAAGLVDEVASEDHVLERAVKLAATHASKRADALSTLAHDLYREAVDDLTSDRGIAYGI